MVPLIEGFIEKIYANDVVMITYVLSAQQIVRKKLENGTKQITTIKDVKKYLFFLRDYLIRSSSFQFLFLKNLCSSRRIDERNKNRLYLVSNFTGMDDIRMQYPFKEMKAIERLNITKNSHLSSQLKKVRTKLV